MYLNPPLEVLIVPASSALNHHSCEVPYSNYKGALQTLPENPNPIL